MKFSNLAILVVTALSGCAQAIAISETTINSLSTFGKRSTLSTILADIEDAASCTACEVYHSLIYSNLFLCTRFNLQLKYMN